MSTYYLFVTSFVPTGFNTLVILLLFTFTSPVAKDIVFNFKAYKEVILLLLVILSVYKAVIFVLFVVLSVYKSVILLLFVVLSVYRDVIFVLFVVLSVYNVTTSLYKGVTKLVTYNLLVKS